MAVCQNLVPLVNIKIAGKWMFIPLKMVLIGIDPSPYETLPLSTKFINSQLWSSSCAILHLGIFEAPVGAFLQSCVLRRSIRLDQQETIKTLRHRSTVFFSQKLHTQKEDCIFFALFGTSPIWRSCPEHLRLFGGGKVRICWHWIGRPLDFVGDLW